MNQTEFPAITCKLLEAREKPRVEGSIGYGFITLVEYLEPVSRTSRKRLGPEKTFVTLRLAYSVKLAISYVVKGIKVISTTNFRASIRLRFEDTKRTFKPNSQSCRQSFENHSIRLFAAVLGARSIS